MEARAVVLVALGAAAFVAGAAAIAWFAPAEPAATSASDVAAAEAAPGRVGWEVDDPEGDARLYNGDYAVKSAVAECRRYVPNAARANCATLFAASALPAPYAEVGTPAPPSSDLVGARLEETPTTLVVVVEVASLDESFTGSLTGDEEEWPAYGVCWGEWDPVGECAYIAPYLFDGTVVVEAYYDIYDGECNDWWWCTRGVPFTIEYGAPATIRIEIPRDILRAGDEGDTLPLVGAGIGRNTPAPTCCLEASANLPVIRYATGDARVIHDVDRALTTDAFRFETASAAVPSERAAFADLDEIEDAELDILETVVVETPESFTYATRFESVLDEPTPHTYIGFMSVSSSAPVYYFWATAENGTRIASGGFCENADAANCAWVTLPVGLEVVHGTPGWVNLTLTRSSLPPISAGDTTTMLWGGAGRPEGRAPLLATGLASVTFWQPGPSPGDWSAPLPAYRFRYDTGASATTPARTTLSDPRGDAVLPPVVGEEFRGQLDITGAEVEGTSPTTTRVALGVADLSQVRVPLGYDAMFYVVGFSTPYGDVMVGYHKNSPGRGGTQEFFCSQDIAAFAEDAGDPMDVVRIPIEGVIAAAGSSDARARGGGSTSGSIIFHVPHDCFPEAPPGPFAASRMGAGSFLVQDPSGQNPDVLRVDDVQTTEAIVLGARAPAPVDDARWFTRPFGIDNFWDMFGIGAAVLTSAVGIGLVQRRRGILKKYLAAIEKAVADNADGSAREAALRQIRSDVKRDLMKGAISEGHYVIVERRLDEHLSKARLAALSDAFDDLPHALLQKLQELLSDGQMGKDEYRLFCTHLERTRLTEDAKDDIKRRVALWVAEDAAVAGGAEGKA